MFNLIKANLDRHVRLDENEYKWFLDKITIHTYQKDSHLFQSGQICTYTYFVNKGLLRLYDINQKGYEKNTLFAKEEWWVLHEVY